VAGLTSGGTGRAPAIGRIGVPGLLAVAGGHLGMWIAMLWHMSAPHADVGASLGAIGVCLGISAVAAVGVRRRRVAWSHVLVDGLCMAAAVAVVVVLGGTAGHGSSHHVSALDMRGPALLVVTGVWMLARRFGHGGRQLARARRFATALPMLGMFGWMIVAC